MENFKVGDKVAVMLRSHIEKIATIKRETKLYVFLENYYGGSCDLKFRKSDGCEPGDSWSLGNKRIKIINKDISEAFEKSLTAEKIKKISSDKERLLKMTKTDLDVVLEILTGRDNGKL